MTWQTSLTAKNAEYSAAKRRKGRKNQGCWTLNFQLSTINLLRIDSRAGPTQYRRHACRVRLKAFYADNRGIAKAEG